MKYYDAPITSIFVANDKCAKDTSVFGATDTGNAIKMYNMTQAALSHFLYNFLMDQ